MSHDLNDLYAALATDADAVLLPPAHSLRQGADRRARVFTVAVCLLAMVILGGVSVAVRPYFAKVAPSVGSTPPAEIPDFAFLVVPADLVDEDDPLPHEDSEFPRPTETPTVCGSVPDMSLKALERTQITTIKQPQEGVPTGTVAHEIVIFHNDGAAMYLAWMRDLLRSGCPVEEGTVPRIVDGEPRGDDSMLVEIANNGEVEGYIWIVRLGDVLTSITVVGPESLSDRAVADRFADLGVAAVRAWLGY